MSVTPTRTVMALQHSGALVEVASPSHHFTVRNAVVCDHHVRQRAMKRIYAGPEGYSAGSEAAIFHAANLELSP